MDMLLSNFSLHIVLALCTIITHFIVTSEETYGFVAIIPPSAYWDIPRVLGISTHSMASIYTPRYHVYLVWMNLSEQRKIANDHFLNVMRVRFI
jgi:hypothetical protein